MITVKTVRELRAAVQRARNEGKRIAFVPTMGNLHAGHVSLVEMAGQRAEFVIASIFVNPLQFGPSEDLDSYPRTLLDDQEKLHEAGCQLLFAPSVEEMYPDGMALQTQVQVSGVSEGLCGSSRPGHFNGVATVVTKLFNMVQPDIAIFGEKDFQQLALIRKMVADMGYDIEIIGVPIVRAKDGLALSSRNGYLTADQRKIAPGLYKVLSAVAEKLAAGDRQLDEIIAIAEQELNEKGFRADDIQIRDADTLLELTDASQRAVILMAAWLGQARLIDNRIVTLAQ